MTAFSGSPVKQAPKVLTAMLVALEHVVICAQTPRYYQVFSWWLLVQNWATLGFRITGASFQATGFSAQLTRSKTLGDDRTIGTGAGDENCRTTLLQPCRTKFCAWSKAMMGFSLSHTVLDAALQQNFHAQRHSDAWRERFLWRLVSSSKRTTRTYRRPTNQEHAAQWWQNCKRTWSTLWQRQKLLFNSTDQFRRRCDGGGT